MLLNYGQLRSKPFFVFRKFCFIFLLNFLVKKILAILVSLLKAQGVDWMLHKYEICHNSTILKDIKEIDKLNSQLFEMSPNFSKLF